MARQNLHNQGMATISTEKRATILRCLSEGNSIASTTRITGAAKNTIIKFLAIAGDACLDYQNRTMVDLPCEELQMDEIHSFVGCREKTKKKAKGEHPGDVWTWIAIDANSKIVPTWYIGDRSGDSAYTLCADLAPRLANRCQITTDGLGAYRFAIGANFSEVDYAQLIKIYGKDESGNEIVIGTRKELVFGNPDIDLVNTSYIERQNLTLRMQNPPLHTQDERLQQEAGKPRPHDGDPLHGLQLLQEAPDAEDDASGRGWDR